MILKFTLFAIAILAIYPQLDFLRGMIAAGCLALVVPQNQPDKSDIKTAADVKKSIASLKIMLERAKATGNEKMVAAIQRTIDLGEKVLKENGE